MVRRATVSFAMLVTNALLNHDPLISYTRVSSIIITLNAVLSGERYHTIREKLILALDQTIDITTNEVFASEVQST